MSDTQTSPKQGAQFGMVIDLKRCIGCHACSVACKSENNLPNRVWWNRVTTDGGDEIDLPRGTYPNLTMQKIAIACQHCSNPACTKVCPVGATSKDPETGIVRQDYERCIGCRMCMAACPYTGVRSFNWEEPQYYIDHATGSQEAPKHQKHTVEKCILCESRTTKGDLPACIDPCPGRARYFGDFNDPSSEVSKLIVERKHTQLLENQGTSPNVYYLI